MGYGDTFGWDSKMKIENRKIANWLGKRAASVSWSYRWDGGGPRAGESLSQSVPVSVSAPVGRSLTRCRAATYGHNREWGGGLEAAGARRPPLQGFAVLGVLAANRR